MTARDPLPAWLKLRERITLVQWIPTRDGDKPLTVDGDFMGRTSTVYQVRVKGRIHDYPRNVWTPCLP